MTRRAFRSARAHVARGIQHHIASAAAAPLLDMINGRGRSLAGGARWVAHVAAASALTLVGVALALADGEGAP